VDHIHSVASYLPDDRMIGGGVGDENVDVGGTGEGVEQFLTEFGGIYKSDASSSAVDHGSLGLSFGRIRSGQSKLGGDSICSEESDISTQSFESGYRICADDRLGYATDSTGDHAQ